MKFAAVIFLLLLAAGCNQTMLPYPTPFHVGLQTLHVAVADTDATRAQGLSDRDPLSDSQGMLFDFRNVPGHKPGFWMKDMKFDLDFIWIENNAVTGITPNVPAPKSATEDLKLYYPPGNVDMVLEVNSGWATEHKTKIGDKANF